MNRDHEHPGAHPANDNQEADGATGRSQSPSQRGAQVIELPIPSRPPYHLSGAGLEARMRAARTVARVLLARGVSGRRLSEWWGCTEGQVRQMLRAERPISLDRLFAPKCPLSLRLALLEALSAEARRAA